jgi:hypothetical protein
MQKIGCVNFHDDPYRVERIKAMAHIHNIETFCKGDTYELKECSFVIPILLLFGLFLAHKQDMSIADVGRHIGNGEASSTTRRSHGQITTHIQNLHEMLK